MTAGPSQAADSESGAGLGFLCAAEATGLGIMARRGLNC
jgi:hypothetical protein